VALVLLAGGGLAVYFLVRDKAPAPVASSNPPAQLDTPTPTTTPVVKPSPPLVPPPDDTPFPKLPPNPIRPPKEIGSPQSAPADAVPQLPDLSRPIEPAPTPKTNPKPPAEPAPEPKNKQEPAAEPAPVASNGKIPPQAREKAKRATVFIKVTMANGQVASGSGFFGVPESRNLILTNAHVVGMLSPGSRPPQRIEVHINSGQSDERRLGATVLGVDRSSDLAVLDVGEAMSDLPEPLKVKAAAGLSELTDLFTFGFPLGEQLGKEITIRPTTVSSLRKNGGVLDRIQVNGGMDPGNSGGPVVDAAGDVVGVAVAGIEGRLINFAIPGERVNGVLNGRLAEMGLHQPFVEGERVGVPVVMVMIDPRQRVQEVALDVWVSDPPPDNQRVRPPTDVAPASMPGDSPRQHCKLPYDPTTRQAKGEVLLPELPAGKVYWIQPNWVSTGGQQHWVTANVYTPPEPVERTPANLTLRAAGTTARPLKVHTTTSFRINDRDDDDEGLMAQIRTEAELSEQTARSTGAGLSLRLHYQKAGTEIVVNKERQPDDTPAGLLAALRQLAIVLQFDAKGNLTRNDLDPATVQQVLGAGPGPLLQERMKQINKIHEPIKSALSRLIVPLPGREVQPKESWTTQRQVLIEGLRDDLPAQLEMTYTYLGQRNRNGRAEAVLDVAGVLRGLPGKEGPLGGKATGIATVDLTTGQVSACEVRVRTETEQMFPIRGGGFKALRVISVQASRLERGL
jgi:S1-C subfamily serine protease